MLDALKALTTSPIFSLGSLILALVSLAANHVLYKRGLRDKEPCWDIRTTNLIQGDQATLPDLEIRYRGTLR